MSKLETWPDFRSVSGDTLTKSVMVTGLYKNGGSVTQNCVCVSHCEQRPNEYLDDEVT
jgi:hypothetical protein